MSRVKVVVFATAVSLATMVSGCTTMGGTRDKPLTSGQKIAGCVAQIALLEIIGREVGANKGVGAAVGAATCAAWIYFNNEQDKKRIAEAEQRALQTGEAQQVEWTGSDNRAKTVRVSFADNPTASVVASGNYCRTMNTEVAVAGQQAINSAVMCRVETADGVRWEPQGSTST